MTKGARFILNQLGIEPCDPGYDKKLRFMSEVLSYHDYQIEQKDKIIGAYAQYSHVKRLKRRPHERNTVDKGTE